MKMSTSATSRSHLFWELGISRITCSEDVNAKPMVTRWESFITVFGVEREGQVRDGGVVGVANGVARGDCED